MKLGKYWPVVIFFIVFALLVGAYLYYAPSWGLQDDFQSLNIADSVWQSENFLGSLWDIIIGDLSSWGIFRPVYYATVAINYHFFRDIPLLLYISVTIFNSAALLWWGVVITNLFSVKEKHAQISTFLFPLSFFIFTPFWNIFTHISFQEKYIVFFSAAVLYFLEKAYRKDKPAFLIPVVIFTVLGMLSKPTGIYLTMSCIAFAAVDLVLFKYKKRISLWVLALNSAIFLFYYWFITSNLRGYAGQYSLTLESIISNLWNSPVMIRILIAIALLMSFCSAVIIMRKRNNFSPLVLMIPFGFLSYVLVLAPWRLVNYLLSALTPYVLIMFFPLYIWLNYKGNISRILVNTCLIVLVIASFFFIAVPRISRLADIKKAEEFIVSFNKNDDTYFFPPPFSEAADAVSIFTSAEVVYLNKGILAAERLHPAKKNYLIVNNEASAITLDGVRIGKAVYENNTWRIFQLTRGGQSKEIFEVDFSENSAEKFKSFLRDL